MDEIYKEVCLDAEDVLDLPWRKAEVLHFGRAILPEVTGR